MDKRDLSIRAYLIETKYYLGESNNKRVLEYIQYALDIVEGTRIGDFEDEYINQYRKELKEK
ncbi:hypothetical protein V2O22_00325 [Streptococcus pneumoniae]|nr:hypothetical protein [Streptococcus pneumoniae]